jgi:hypothetical protein
VFELFVVFELNTLSPFGVRSADSASDLVFLCRSSFDVLCPVLWSASFLIQFFVALTKPYIVHKAALIKVSQVNQQVLARLRQMMIGAYQQPQPHQQQMLIATVQACALIIFPFLFAIFCFLV